MKTNRYVYEVANDAKKRFTNNEDVCKAIDKFVQLTENGLLTPLMCTWYIANTVNENGWGHNEE